MLEIAMRLALEKASAYVGSTAPNPPVGAAALDAEGRVLAVCAHERAGDGHAEAQALKQCEREGTLSRLHTMVVTLEPCNHQGRTPPCSEGLIAAGVKRVVFGAKDPNPKVAGNGETRLKSAGIEVVSGLLRPECESLIEPFAHWCLTGLPYVTIKTAYDRTGSMIPPAGSKTFTSADSLKLAHGLRKRADAILTGSGTVLADRPELTVRHVPDHPGKRRHLVVLDRRGRVPADWVEEAHARGFEVRIEGDLESALKYLGKLGVLEVLVEAGPTLTQALLSSGLWNRHVVITQGNPGMPDQVETRCSQGSSKK